jgi:DNA-binding NtrC family response regulator
VNGSRRIPASPRGAQVTVAQKTVLVGDDRDWPPDLKDSLGRDGYFVDRVTELSLVPSLLADGRMRAIFVVARPLAASDLLLLRRVRETSPRTAIVVVTRTPTHPDLKRAFESGATAFLSWPASTDALRQAIESGDVPPPPVSRLRP